MREDKCFFYRSCLEGAMANLTVVDRPGIIDQSSVILHQAMTKVSGELLNKEIKNPNTYWRVWEIGGTSPGAKTFCHALYRGTENTSGLTPEKDSLITLGDYIVKLYWLDFPPEAFQKGNQRNVCESFENEVNILTALKDSHNNPCVDKIKSNKMTIEVDGHSQNIGWIQMERLYPIPRMELIRDTTKVLQLVTQLHGLGYTHNDIHIHNIMRRDDRSLVLIDLESARPATEKDKTADLEAVERLCWSEPEHREVTDCIISPFQKRMSLDRSSPSMCTPRPGRLSFTSELGVVFTPSLSPNPTSPARSNPGPSNPNPTTPPRSNPRQPTPPTPPTPYTPPTP